MRNMDRENLFERWLTEVVRVAGPYEDYETFAHFSERIKNLDTCPECGDEVRYCCSGQECGCMGLPIEPCSCYDTVSDTVIGDAEVSPASEKRDELSNDSERSTNPGNADPRTQVHQRQENSEQTQGRGPNEDMGNRDAQIAREGSG